jgi:hypothetical protein
MTKRKVKISEKEIIEMVTEAVTKKIVKMVENHKVEKKYNISEAKLVKLMLQELKNFDDISDENVFGSDNYDVADEYEACDYETVMDVIKDNHWICKEYFMVVSPTGQKAVRYRIEQRHYAFGEQKDSNPINQVIGDLKSRSIKPEGVRVIKGNKVYSNPNVQPYFILSYIYKN